MPLVLSSVPGAGHDKIGVAIPYRSSLSEHTGLVRCPVLILAAPECARAVDPCRVARSQ